MKISVPTGTGDLKRDWVLGCGERYWETTRHLISALPISNESEAASTGKWTEVPLPPWAEDLGVRGSLLVDSACLPPGQEGAPWQNCDWISAAWFHLTGALERAHEARSGPIASYAFRLHNAPAGLFDHAWVNRIFLFLRRWAAVSQGLPEAQMFGSLPEANIMLTHDVDAVKKTLELRLKQSAFHGFNALRSVRQPTRAIESISRAVRFGFLGGRFHTLGLVRALENAHGLTSTLHFYGGRPGWQRANPARLLVDPAYDIASPYLRNELRNFISGGWGVGLHQSTAAWRNPEIMLAERNRVAAAADIEISVCRQHWLRFSWAETWIAQKAAGLATDSTLGFNDRPGFRNGAALAFSPWDFAASRPMSGFTAQPMVFMDSHFHDYQPMDDETRLSTMQRWLKEIRAVHGVATVNWHTHTITDAYGWRPGYEQLLELLAR